MTLIDNLKKSMQGFYKNTCNEEFNALTQDQKDILKKVADSKTGIPYNTDMVYLVNRGYISVTNGNTLLAQKGQAVLNEFS